MKLRRTFNKHGCLSPTPRQYSIGLGTGMFGTLLGGFVSGLELTYQSPRIEWFRKTEISSLMVLEVGSQKSVSLKSRCQQGPAPSDAPGENPSLASTGFWGPPAYLDLQPYLSALCLLRLPLSSVCLLSLCL